MMLTLLVVFLVQSSFLLRISTADVDSQFDGIKIYYEPGANGTADFLDRVSFFMGAKKVEFIPVTNQTNLTLFGIHDTVLHMDVLNGSQLLRCLGEGKNIEVCGVSADDIRQYKPETKPEYYPLQVKNNKKSAEENEIQSLPWILTNSSKWRASDMESYKQHPVTSICTIVGQEFCDDINNDRHTNEEEQIPIKIDVYYNPGNNETLDFLKEQIHPLAAVPNWVTQLVPYGSKPTNFISKVHACAAEHVTKPITFIRWILMDNGFGVANPVELKAYEKCVKSKNETNFLLKANGKLTKKANVESLPWIHFNHSEWPKYNMTEYRTQLADTICGILGEGTRKKASYCRKHLGATIFPKHPKINIFYEAMTQNFTSFLGVLDALYKSKMMDHLDFDLFPFGSTEVVQKKNKAPTFICPLGGTQCRVNKIHACAVKYIPEENMRRSDLLFVRCFQLRNYTELSDVSKCTPDQDAVSAIWRCVQGDLGNRLLVKNSKMMAAAGDRKEFLFVTPGHGTVQHNETLWEKKFNKETQKFLEYYACQSVGEEQCHKQRHYNKRQWFPRGAYPDEGDPVR